MGRADVYRRYAVECLEQAKSSSDQHASQDLIKLAEMWARLASLADAGQEPSLDLPGAAQEVPPPDQGPPAEKC
jgi:hypothetical protein